MNARTLGLWGEDLITRALERRGYSVEREQQRKRGDLRAISPTGEIIRIEVKTARRSRTRPRWQFCMRRDGPRVMTDCHYADVAVLVCVNRIGLPLLYVIPTSDIACKQIAIVDTYGTASKWFPYRQHLHTIEVTP